ncbi:MAG: metallophosphoesterase [Marinilabiliaceae bacterium]|nr:metallophosphoesterase [Marinilabiliaceae bacterium]
MKRIIFYLLPIVLFSYCTKDTEETDSSPEPVKESMRKIDGPYIMYEDDNIVNYKTNAKGELESALLSTDDVLEVYAANRTPEYFEFKLMTEFTEVPAITKDGELILAISDIEGNYHAFTKLLIGNGVTDENLNWTYGKKHLVLVGDMVDRGTNVTQVLWLIYKLEKEALAAGGQVHFILGNHDIMCMAGDDRYAASKYLIMARLMNVSYKDLYGINAEFGRWMRTKHVIEKIDDYIFEHGGISPDVLQLNLSIQEMNDKVRPYYGLEVTQSAPTDVFQLSKTSGLYWYRGYVKGKDDAYEKATQAEVTSILDRYQAKAIIVGHCVVDQIEAEYNGGVVTVDVEQADGDNSRRACQALLIEDGKMYRVNENAERVALN